MGEKETYRSARAAWDYLTVDRGIDERDIILFGRSLGSAVAIELSTHVLPRALILESSFTSLPEIGARSYPFLPVRLLARIRYNSMDRIQEVRVPKLFVHSLDDDLIPLGMGKRLYNRAPRPKVWARAHGDHNAVYLTNGSRYDATFREFIKSLDEPRHAAIAGVDDKDPVKRGGVVVEVESSRRIGALDRGDRAGMNLDVLRQRRLVSSGTLQPAEDFAREDSEHFTTQLHVVGDHEPQRGRQR